MIKAYEVGGCVRDRIMGLRSKDTDYAVEAPSYADMVAWIKERGEIFLEQPQFWTVRAHIKGKPPADFVLCRRDGQYSDGRRPDTVMVGTLQDDLARRDFTMNAIALSETGEYIDPHNGRKDIEDRLIRCVGDAHERMNEDALRVLRAIRFAITKDMAIHMDLYCVFMDEKLTDKLRDSVSDERKREELARCFSHDTLATLAYLEKFPLIKKACFGSRKMRLMPTMKL